MHKSLGFVLIIGLAFVISSPQLLAQEFSLKHEERRDDSFISFGDTTARISLAENLLRGLCRRAESQRVSNGTWNIVEGIFPLAGGIYLVDWANLNEEKDVKRLGYFTAGLGAFEILSGIRSLAFKSSHQKKYEHILAIDNSTPYGKKARERAAASALKALARKAKIERLVAGSALGGFALYWVVSQPFKGDPYSQYNYYAAGMWGLFGLIAFFGRSDEETAYNHYLANRGGKGYIKVYGGILPGEGYFIKVRYSF